MTDANDAKQVDTAYGGRVYVGPRQLHLCCYNTYATTAAHSHRRRHLLVGHLHFQYL